MNIKNSLKHVNINEYEYEIFFDNYKNFGKLEKKIENGILGVMKNFGKKIKL